jgi:chromosome segregation ATPase
MTISELKEQLRQRDLQLEKQAAQLERQAARIKKQAARIKELERKIEELKNLLVDKAKSKESKPPKEASNYSVSRHEQKQRRKRGRKKSTGRKPKDAKRDFTTETIDLYWHGAKRRKCVLRREQFVWRLMDGKAKYIHYRVFDEPDCWSR